jgi:hypothetical protein
MLMVVAPAPRGPHDDARHDELAHAGGETGDEADRREEREPAHVELLAPDHVGEAPDHQDQRSLRQHVAQNYPHQPEEWRSQLVGQLQQRDDQSPAGFGGD